MSSEYLKRLDVQGHLRVKKALIEWDPIGVLDDPDWPKDEYDSYSGPVVNLLDRGAPKDEIVNYLRTVCEHQIGIGFNQAKTSRIVDELMTYWPEWKKQLQEQNSV